MTISTLEHLKQAGWDVSDCHLEWPDRDRSVQSFQKTTDDGVHLIVSIHPNGVRFDVWSSAEHRLSGPNGTCEASTTTLDEAIAAAKAACDEWDEDVDPTL